MMSDGELVRQALRGQAGAYEQLLSRWAPRITAVCHAKAGRGPDAEDLAQESLLRGYRALATLADPDRFGAWLYGIALRVCRDWRKAKERSQVPFSVLASGQVADGLPDPAEPGEEAPGERADEARHVMAQVEALPEECREVLMLFYYDDLSYRAIAQMLGVSTATVNARLTKARAVLRTRLSRSRA